MKSTATLLLAALTLVAANPALAHCGAIGGKRVHAAAAPKQPSIAGLSTAPALPATTAEAAPFGLATDRIGS
jgi:hypothetical protein